jgi:hypothetical protein
MRGKKIWHLCLRGTEKLADWHRHIQKRQNSLRRGGVVALTQNYFNQRFKDGRQQTTVYWNK